MFSLNELAFEGALLLVAVSGKTVDQVSNSESAGEVQADAHPLPRYVVG